MSQGVAGGEVSQAGAVGVHYEHVPTDIDSVPLQGDLRAIRRPSGERVRTESLVSPVRPLPSAFITQISGCVVRSRSLTKPIFVPSGDQAGSLSSNKL
jgi:hypothetical protein